MIRLRISISQKHPEKKNIILYCGLCLRLPPHSCIIKMLSMATSFQKFRIWKENVLEELYRKYQGKTIKDDYGKNSKEFIDFANDMKKSMKINATKYGLRLITFETGHYDMCGYFKDNETKKVCIFFIPWMQEPPHRFRHDEL